MKHVEGYIMNTIIYVSITHLLKQATCFDPTLGHPQACGRLNHWCCVCILGSQYVWQT